MQRIAVAVLGLVVLGTAVARAAIAPLSKEGLRKQASHIVTGSVVAVTSKTQKSKVEKAWGIHRDRVFKIKLKVSDVSKGEGIRVDDVIEVEAWRPVRRLPPLPGPQGHSSIPRKGDTATVHAEKRKDGVFEPILPNGISIQEPEGGE